MMGHVVSITVHTGASFPVESDLDRRQESDNSWELPGLMRFKARKDT